MKLLRELSLERLIELKEKEDIKALWNKAIEDGHELNLLKIADGSTEKIEKITVELVENLIKDLEKGFSFGLLTNEDPTKNRSGCQWWEILYCP